MHEEIDTDRFGEALKSWAEDKNVSLLEVARRGGFYATKSSSTITFYMLKDKKRRTKPGLDKLIRIANALDITVGELIRGRNGEGLKQE